MTTNGPITLANSPETSLSTLDGHEWAQLQSTWAKGILWFTAKVGRKWEITGRLGQGFPLFTTRKAAYAAGTTLVIAEGHHRYAVRAAAEAAELTEARRVALVCDECDCADPTAADGLEADCDCDCHQVEARKIYQLYEETGDERLRTVM